MDELVPIALVHALYSLGPDDLSIVRGEFGYSLALSVQAVNMEACCLALQCSLRVAIEARRLGRRVDHLRTDKIALSLLSTRLLPTRAIPIDG